MQAAEREINRINKRIRELQRLRAQIDYETNELTSQRIAAQRRPDDEDTSLDYRPSALA